MEVDVLIVGAGPAGCTTARFCSDRHLEVMVIDRRTEIGYPVQCGEFLPDPEEMYTIFPKSMDLDELFSLEKDLVMGESQHIDIISPKGRHYRCSFGGKTLDRRAFDKYLARLAMDNGARVETGVSFLSLQDGIAKTTMGDVSAKVIVAADGPNSRTARAAGLRNPAKRYPALTCQVVGRFEPVVSMYFGNIAPGGYAWVIPKRSGANVGVGIDPRTSKERPSELLDRFVAKLGCGYSERTMGFVPMSGPVLETVSGKTILVGDSAGFVMPPNGGGIPTAMIGGRIAGTVIREHLLRGLPLGEYDRRWRRILAGPLMTGSRTHRMACVFFQHELALESAMLILGRRGLDRAIRCKRSLYVL